MAPSRRHVRTPRGHMWGSHRQDPRGCAEIEKYFPGRVRSKEHVAGVRTCQEILLGHIWQGSPHTVPRAATADPGSQILILRQVSKPLSKLIENVSFATLSGDLNVGVHDPVVFDPFNLNGSNAFAFYTLCADSRAQTI